MIRSLSLVLVGLAATAAAEPQLAPAGSDPALARGAYVAQLECAQCHAVEREGRSPNPAAPTFQAIRLRFNPIALERRLHPMPAQGHDAMPPSTLSASDVPDLVAYIQSLGPTR